MMDSKTTKPNRYPFLDYQESPDTLHLPFEHAVNPHWGEARLLSQRWVRKTGIVAADQWDAYTGARFDELSARGYPHVSLSTLVLLMDFITTIFVLDDLLDNQASSLGSQRETMVKLSSYLAAAIETRERGRFRVTPYAQTITAIGNALADVSDRMHIADNSAGIELFTRGFSNYQHACFEEAMIRHGRTPSIAGLVDYARLRINSTAMNPCLELALLAEGVHLPDTLRTTPAFQCLWDSAILSIGYINDIFSYNKDVAHGHTTNLLMVLRDKQDLSIQAALDRAREIHNETMSDYLHAKKTLYSALGEDDNLVFLTTMLESWMRGSHRWSRPGKNERYTDYTSTASFESPS